MATNNDWIPHNLPPRSEFIGREEAKALVHEALRSRSYLISIDGIGGIGKTSLALEVAYECLQVSQYVQQLNRTTSPPEPIFEQEVLDLPPQIYNRLQSTLLKCGPFDSEVELRAMFVDARISPWRDSFPEMRNRVSRVNVLIDELLHRYATTGENALLLFLQVLTERASAGDACHSDLTASAAELEHVLKGQRKTPDTHPELPALPPSLDVQKIARFEGFIWATAKDRTLSLNDLLDAVARTLDYIGIAQKPLVEKRFAVEKLLRTLPCLLVVDNLETISDDTVRDFLLNLPEPSKALITTREQKLERAWAVSLKGLTETEALAFMRSEGKRLGMQTLEHAKGDVLLYLYQATGGAPLAIKWAVGQITQRGQSLDTVLNALYEARGNLFDDIFSRSWELLSKDARIVLMVMPFFATSALREGIKAASGIHHFALDEALGQLVQMSLVEAADELGLEQKRYSIHSLTRAFSEALLITDENFTLEARSRLAMFYVGRCQAIEWGDTSVFPWIRAELVNILAMMEWANSNQRWEIVTSIFAENLSEPLETMGYWHELIKYGKLGLNAAQHANDLCAIANNQYIIGWVLAKQRHYAEARNLLVPCIESYLDMECKEKARRAMITLAKLAISERDLDAAGLLVSKIMKIFGIARYQDVIGLSGVQGRIELQSGNLDQAHDLLVHTLKEAQEQAFEINIGGRQIELGQIALARKQFREAEDYFRAGLESSRQDNIAKAEFNLAQVFAYQKKMAQAIKLAHKARERFLRLGMEVEVSETDKLINRLIDNKGIDE